MAAAEQNRAPLPVDDILEQLRRQLEEQRVVVLEAPPGAGKTTRVPLALYRMDWLAGRKILMLEPRRLAARNAADYMARLLGEKTGQTVGYTIRFEHKTSRQTRIEVVTEGILTRRLQSDPELSDVGLVIFDEFHERNIHSDLGLALVNDLREGLREELRILVMSATLAAAPLVKLLRAGHLRSEGRSWPVDIRYLGDAIDLDCTRGMLKAIRQAVGETSGDILAFLPGAREIDRLQRHLQQLDLPLLTCPLHGSLPHSAQQTALLPAGRRKLILATNIAETSLTIDGVTTVIDSGLCRRAGFNAGSGLDRLTTEKISQASSQQRAGRAGRQQPGICYRLWSAAEQATLLPQTPAEIRNSDLVPLALDLACWGLQDANQLDWLDPPPKGAMLAAKDLLQQLGLLDHQGRPTPTGHEAARLPVHPRFAAMLLRAREVGQLPAACLLTVLLSEQSRVTRNEEDLLCSIEQTARDLARGLQNGSPLERAFAQLSRIFRCSPPGAESLQTRILAPLLLCAYPDRLAYSQRQNCDFLLANDQGVRLQSHSQLVGSQWLIVCDINQQENRLPQVRSALRADAQLVEELADAADWQTECGWDDEQQRIKSFRTKRYGALVLARQQAPPTTEQTLALLCDRIRRDGSHLLDWNRETLQFLGRLRLLHATFGAPWPDPSLSRLLEQPEDWLAPYISGVTSISQLGRLKLLPALQSLLDWTLARQVDQLAPEKIEVPSGERMRIDYQAGEPVLPVKLQQLFGLAETPAICQGRVALKLQLLSPAGRPLAVTSDLPSFWDKVYPEVKKEMRGRYPKHPWPDDPWNAVPTRKTKKHLR